MLIAIAHHRDEWPRDLLAFGLGALTVYTRRAVLLAVPGARRYRAAHDESGMPVRAPALTIRETRGQVRAALPAARVRRLLQWRYEVRWDKPRSR